MAIPLIVLARTTLTDAFRSVDVAEGTAPFEHERSALGRFLVGSSWMRTSYAASKTITFCGLALSQALAEGSWLGILRWSAWITIGLCVARGLPVISGSLRQYWRQPQPDPV